MLYIHLIKPEKVIYNIDRYFNSHKNGDWFEEKLIKDIVMGIDKTKVIKGEFLESPVFGAMSPDRLSSGCKAVILMHVQDRPVYATMCGDNCAEWILKVADNKDVYIHLNHCMIFPYDMEATFVETGVKVSNRQEYAKEFFRIVHSWEN